MLIPSDFLARNAIARITIISINSIIIILSECFLVLMFGEALKSNPHVRARSVQSSTGRTCDS